MRDPIYKPKGAALEYANYALNIYTGCPHGCAYCYVPAVLRKSKEEFHSDVRPRDGIIEAVETQLAKGKIKDQLIHLCFTCDPYPRDYDDTPTREIIKLIKASGNHVQILTKNPIRADIDILDAGDVFGVTIDSYRGDYNIFLSCQCILMMEIAKKNYGLRTWISAEPFHDADKLEDLLSRYTALIDKISIGKLNHIRSDVDWKAFGVRAESLCQQYGMNYTIKDSLRKEMER